MSSNNDKVKIVGYAIRSDKRWIKQDLIDGNWYYTFSPWVKESENDFSPLLKEKNFLEKNFKNVDIVPILITAENE
jgi:hypothetical protein